MKRRDQGVPSTEVRKQLLDGFSQDLRHQRLSAGLTQGDLAKRAAMHVTEISLLERGKREPRIATLIKLASVLNVSLEDFYETALEFVDYVPNEGWQSK